MHTSHCWDIYVGNVQMQSGHSFCSLLYLQWHLQSLNDTLIHVHHTTIYLLSVQKEDLTLCGDGPYTFSSLISPFYMASSFSQNLPVSSIRLLIQLDITDKQEKERIMNDMQLFRMTIFHFGCIVCCQPNI
ncbi:unnamed protein product [Musa textilis]